MKILRVDSDERKIGLSLKRAQWAQEEEVREDARSQRAEKRGLRGGLEGGEQTRGSGRSWAGNQRMSATQFYRVSSNWRFTMPMPVRAIQSPRRPVHHLPDRPVLPAGRHRGHQDPRAFRLPGRFPADPDLLRAAVFQ